MRPPEVLKNFIAHEQMQYQLTPPHFHRCNAAERAIRTFKNHFISGLCSVDKIFPYTYGDACWTKQNSPSTCYICQELIQTYRPTSSSTASMTSMQHLWHHQEPSALPMKNLANVEHGPRKDSMSGM